MRMKPKYESKGRMSGKGAAIVLLYALLMIGWAGDSFAGLPAGTTVYLEGGYLSGNNFRMRSKMHRMHYVQGVIDGFLFAPFLGAPEKDLTPLGACIQGMPAGQLLAIVDQYVASKPSNWDQQMNVLVYSAMVFACKDRNRPLN